MADTNPNGENGEGVFESAAQELQTPVTMTEAGVMITALEVHGARWRRHVVAFLAHIDPEAHAEYHKRKYTPSDVPNLATRKAAYEFAALHALEHHFDHEVIVGWRHMAADIVKALDFEAHQQYNQIKYGAGEPDTATKIEAYRIVVKRFLDLAYTLPDTL